MGSGVCVRTGGASGKGVWMGDRADIKCFELGLNFCEDSDVRLEDEPSDMLCLCSRPPVRIDKSGNDLDAAEEVTREEEERFVEGEWEKYPSSSSRSEDEEEEEKEEQGEAERRRFGGGTYSGIRSGKATSLIILRDQRSTFSSDSPTHVRSGESTLTSPDVGERDFCFGFPSEKGVGGSVLLLARVNTVLAAALGPLSGV